MKRGFDRSENFDIFSCLANHFLAPPGHLLNPPSPFLDDEKWTKEIWTHYNRFKDLVNENADINNPNSPIPPTPALSQPDFNIVEPIASGSVAGAHAKGNARPVQGAGNAGTKRSNFPY